MSSRYSLPPAVALVFVVALSSIATAETSPRLVPVFAHRVPGANWSLWDSELRLYNAAAVPAVVEFQNVFPFLGNTCTVPQPVILNPGALVILRGVACSQGSAAALEVLAPIEVDIQAVVVNLQSFTEPSGFTQSIPIFLLPGVYSSKRTVATLSIPKLSDGRQAVRHNLGIINPNAVPVDVSVRDYDADGTFVSGFIFTLDPRTTAQINNHLGTEPNAEIPVPPVKFGLYRVDVEATAPVYLYDSAVDNITNDATFIQSVARNPAGAPSN